MTDMLRSKDGNFFISDWLRNRNTIEYLGIWERVHNPDFNYGEFDLIKSKAGLNSYKISVKEWVAKIYTTDDGQAKIDLKLEDGTVWLSQLQIAELFNATKQNISLHLKNIYEDKELIPEATVKESLAVQKEGSKEVARTLTFYNLDVILAVGYRVRSPWTPTNTKLILNPTNSRELKI